MSTLCYCLWDREWDVRAVEFRELFCLHKQTFLILREYDNAHLCDAAAARALSPVMVLK